MSDDNLDLAFEEFLRVRRDARDDLTDRQQLWAAFKAGADWSLDEIRKVLQETKP